LAFISGPALEIATKVSLPIAPTIYLNFLISISASCYAFFTSNSIISLLCLTSASFSLDNYSISASLSIFKAAAFKVAFLT